MADLMYCGVKAIIKREDGRILFLKQKTRKWPNGFLDLPGGRLGTGEDPYDALKREVKEETGLTVNIGKPIGMYYFVNYDNQQLTFTVFECACKDLTARSFQNPDSKEKLSEPQWLTPFEALNGSIELHESFAKILKLL